MGARAWRAVQRGAHACSRTRLRRAATEVSPVSATVYDTGVLIAADRNDRTAWAEPRVGTLLGKAKSSDVVDACVVELAARTGQEIVTSDAADIRRLVAACGKRIVVHVR